MTPEQIQRLRELEEAAPKAPWEFTHHRTPTSLDGIQEEPLITDGDGDWLLREGADYDDYGSFPEEDTWQYLVEARNALPELLDDWERMRAEIDRLHVALKSFLSMTDRLDDWLKAVAASPVVHEHHKGKYVEVQIDGPTWKGLQAFRKWHGPESTGTLDDGFGNTWAKCDRADCQLQIVRPGKAQCSRCEEEEASHD